MAYAIHSRGFEYNDEYYELSNAVSLHKTYANKIEAMSEWAKLERNYLTVDLLIREPFADMESDKNLQNLQVLFDKLREHGVILSKSIAEKLSKIQRQEVNYWDCFIDSQELQLDTLTDEQLLDVLLAVDCNVYRLTEFDPIQDKRYVLQICHPERSYATQGYTYLKNFDEEWSGIWEVAHPDEFFDSDFFKNIEVFEGDSIATLYQQADENNPILQSLLAQYPQNFAIRQQGDEANGETELHYIGGDTQALRAVNAVLSQPFFHIHELSYDELMQLQEEQNQLQNQIQKQQLQEQPQSQYIDSQYEDNLTHYEHKTESSIWQKVRQWFG